MTTLKRILAALTLLVLATHGSDSAQVALNASDALVIEVFGEKAVIEIDGKRFLVEALPPHTPFPAAAGSRIGIEGRHDGNVVWPDRVTLPSGEILRPAAPGAAPPVASVTEQLAREGITAAGRPYRKRNATEIIGRDASGRKLIASFDPSGRLREIEDAEHRHVAPDSPDAVSAAEVESRLRAAGYTSLRLVDQRRYQFLFSAANARGEAMELHVDRAGNVLKRVWLR